MAFLTSVPAGHRDVICSSFTSIYWVTTLCQALFWTLWTQQEARWSNRSHCPPRSGGDPTGALISCGCCTWGRLSVEHCLNGRPLASWPFLLTTQQEKYTEAFFFFPVSFVVSFISHGKRLHGRLKVYLGNLTITTSICTAGQINTFIF